MLVALDNTMPHHCVPCSAQGKNTSPGMHAFKHFSGCTDVRQCVPQEPLVMSKQTHRTSFRPPQELTRIQARW